MPNENDVQWSLDPTFVFVRKLENLLREYNFTLMGGHDGDVTLYSKGGRMLGWWQGNVTEENFKR